MSNTFSATFGQKCRLKTKPNQPKQKNPKENILTSGVRPVFLSLNGENVHFII